MTPSHFHGTSFNGVNSQKKQLDAHALPNALTGCSSNIKYPGNKQKKSGKHFPS